MKLPKTVLVLMILLVLFQIGFGQEFKEDENWINTSQPFLIHALKNYTKEDVVKAKEKLNLIKQSKIDTEWEGSYTMPADMSDTQLLWSSTTGFVNYYIHTCTIELRSLNYGKVINNTDSVILTAEKNQPPFFGTGKTGQIKLIKVKWGDLRFLVEEEDLEVFCELAAGYYGSGKTETIEMNGESYQTQTAIWGDFWVKSEDISNEDTPKKKAFGLPILPKSYERFIKQPIETKIVSIGKYQKDLPADDSMMKYSHRYVNIGAGKNLGIKTGMQFYVSDLGERISIVEVKDKISVGVLERWVDSETHEESCFNNSGDIPCKLPKAGMKIKTIPDDFLEDN